MSKEYISQYTGLEIDAALSKAIDSASAADVARLYDDLYDKKTNIEYTTVYSTVVDINAPNYEKVWNVAEFSGWWGYAGTPQNFNSVRFPIQGRTDYDCTSIIVKVLEMPDANDVTASKFGVSPVPSNWNLLAEKTVVLSEPLAANKFTNITVEFDNIVENAEGKHLFIAILGNTRCTLGYCLINKPDIPYNPWIYYATDGKIGCGALNGAAYTYEFNSTQVYTMVAEFLLVGEKTHYAELGTDKKDKFFNLVNECLNNTDSFGELFDETYTTQHLCGSQNFSINTGGTAHSTTTTFTGIIFPIGVIPQHVVSSGCSFRIKARKSDAGDTTPITKVWAWLYSVDSIPYTQASPYSFATLNPVLLRTGQVECDIAVDTEDIVTIFWNEGEFENTDGKFLMLGYNCNSLNNRCFNADKKTGAQVCSSIDGNTYSTNLETWYSTKKTSDAEWQPRWVDSPYANAWSLIKKQKEVVLSENFNDMLERALDKALEDASLDLKAAPTSEVRLAKQYDLVIGDTFQLFFDGVIKAADALQENIAVRCPKGKTYPRYWEYTPKAGEEGTYTLSLYTRQLDGTIISQGSTNIVVHKQLTNETTPTDLTCLIFGDSLTAAGAWAAEGLRRIYGTSSSASGPASLGVTNKITTYGTKSDTTNTFKVYHEGYGGWTWNSFLAAGNNANSTINGIVVTLSTAHGYDLNTVQKSAWSDNNGLAWQLEDFPSATQIKFNRGENNNATQANIATPTTLTCEALGLTIAPASVVWEAANPFYDEAKQAVSFATHASEHGASEPDVVACLLTWNGGGGTIDFNHSSQITSHMSKASQLLKLIHSDFPNAKIVAMGLQLPSITGGNGHNEGANSFYSDTANLVDYAFEYNKALENMLTTDSELKTYCYYVDTKGQFDTRYNMPWTEYPVNTRNTTTEKRGTNGVHPSTNGYYQIGDAFYRKLSAILPSIV